MRSIESEYSIKNCGCNVTVPTGPYNPDVERDVDDGVPYQINGLEKNLEALFVSIKELENKMEALLKPVQEHPCKEECKTAMTNSRVYYKIAELSEAVW